MPICDSFSRHPHIPDSDGYPHLGKLPCVVKFQDSPWPAYPTTTCRETAQMLGPRPAIGAVEAYSFWLIMVWVGIEI